MTTCTNWARESLKDEEKPLFYEGEILYRTLPFLLLSLSMALQPADRHLAPRDVQSQRLLPPPRAP